MKVAQLIDRNGICRRRPLKWMALAIRLLPTPVSPVSRMLTSESLSSSTVSRMRTMPGLLAMIEIFLSSPANVRSAACSRFSVFCRAILPTLSSSSSRSKGLVT